MKRTKGQVFISVTKKICRGLLTVFIGLLDAQHKSTGRSSQNYGVREALYKEKVVTKEELYKY